MTTANEGMKGANMAGSTKMIKTRAIIKSISDELIAQSGQLPAGRIKLVMATYDKDKTIRESIATQNSSLGFFTAILSLCSKMGYTIEDVERGITKVKNLKEKDLEEL